MNEPRIEQPPPPPPPETAEARQHRLDLRRPGGEPWIAPWLTRLFKRQYRRCEDTLELVLSLRIINLPRRLLDGTVDVLARGVWGKVALAKPLLRGAHLLPPIKTRKLPLEILEHVIGWADPRDLGNIMLASTQCFLLTARRFHCLTQSTWGIDEPLRQGSEHPSTVREWRAIWYRLRQRATHVGLATVRHTTYHTFYYASNIMLHRGKLLIVGIPERNVDRGIFWQDCSRADLKPFRIANTVLKVKKDRVGEYKLQTVMWCALDDDHIAFAVSQTGVITIGELIETRHCPPPTTLPLPIPLFGCFDPPPAEPITSLGPPPRFVDVLAIGAMGDRVGAILLTCGVAYLSVWDWKKAELIVSYWIGDLPGKPEELSNKFYVVHFISSQMLFLGFGTMDDGERFLYVPLPRQGRNLVDSLNAIDAPPGGYDLSFSPWARHQRRLGSFNHSNANLLPPEGECQPGGFIGNTNLWTEPADAVLSPGYDASQLKLEYSMRLQFASNKAGYRVVVGNSGQDLVLEHPDEDWHRWFMWETSPSLVRMHVKTCAPASRFDPPSWKSAHLYKTRLVAGPEPASPARSRRLGRRIWEHDDSQWQLWQNGAMSLAEILHPKCRDFLRRTRISAALEIGGDRLAVHCDEMIAVFQFGGE